MTLLHKTNDPRLWEAHHYVTLDVAQKIGELSYKEITNDGAREYRYTFDTNDARRRFAELDDSDKRGFEDFKQFLFFLVCYAFADATI